MNKNSVKKKRSTKVGAKTSRRPAARKEPARAAAARKAVATRRSPSKLAARFESISAVKISAGDAGEVASVTVAQVTALAPALRSHKYRVGQTVFYTSSPISRPGASGSYKVVRLLPSDGDDYQYRIKNPGEAFERVAKESQLDLEH
jgi:hypothetical protein